MKANTLSQPDGCTYNCKLLFKRVLLERQLTHQYPGTVSVQVVTQTVTNKRHGLYLVKVGIVEEVRQAQALERRENYVCQI